jgi:hypothetical protein
MRISINCSNLPKGKGAGAANLPHRKFADRLFIVRRTRNKQSAKRCYCTEFLAALATGSVLSTGFSFLRTDRLMPTIPVITEPALASLRQALSTLKAAAVVSAAAVLSQGKSDLEANAAAATGHLDNVSRQLHAFRKGVLQDALVPAEEGTMAVDVDIDALDRSIDSVDQHIIQAKDALFAVAESADRTGLEAFAERIGELGRALLDVVDLIAPSAAHNEAPFLFDQFFLESLQELSQRDWSAT